VIDVTKLQVEQIH